MKLVKYVHRSDEPQVGLWQDDVIYPIPLTGQYRSLTELLEAPDPSAEVEFMVDRQGEAYALADVTLLAPIDQQEVWAAGVTSSVFEGISLSCYGRGKRLIVDEYNEVKGLPNIFAIGDTCLQTSDNKFLNGHRQLAQPAIQQGRQLAKNFIAIESGKTRQPFSYYDKGTMAIIGWNKAVVDIPKPRLHFKGFIAWFAWVFVHLMFLINYRNRVRTLYNWTTAYFSKDQTLRMIIRPESKQDRAA